MLQQCALNFCDRDLEHDLLFSLDDQHVDHCFLVGFRKPANSRTFCRILSDGFVFDRHKLFGDVGGARRVGRIFDRSRQNHGLVQHLDLNARARQQAIEQVFDTCSLTLDEDFKGRHLFAIDAKEEGVGFTDFARQHENPV